MRRGELVEGVGTGFIVHKDDILTNSVLLNGKEKYYCSSELTEEKWLVASNDTTLIWRL